MRYRIERECRVARSPRVMQMSGMFDVAYEEKSRQTWDFDVTLPDSWNVGAILGPSGAGKSTVAAEMFGDAVVRGWDWPSDRSVLDGFPSSLGIKEVVDLLSSVGFSSPPAWMRPYAVLSNGEKFRVDMARTLAEMPDLAVVDEFTSVVDRQVAQVGSSCVAKAVRRRGRKFVAVSCHYDILDWLQPDWVFQPHTGVFERRCLQRRPELDLEIHEAGRDAWPTFRPHHYLSADLHTASKAFVATLGGRPVAFNSYLHLPHAKVRDIKIGHRLVVLPDYQGLGIGGRFEEWMGQWLFERGYRYRNVTAHPALIAYCCRSPRWRLMSAGGTGFDRAGQNRLTSKHSKPKNLPRKQGQSRRLATYSFQYVPTRPEPASC